MKRDEILWSCHRHRIEPVTLSKYVAEYGQMWKKMVEFLIKFEGGVIKIDKGNLICVVKSMIFINNLRAIVLCVTSWWAIVFFALSLRRPPLVYLLWWYTPLATLIYRGEWLQSGQVFVVITKMPAMGKISWTFDLHKYFHTVFQF